MLTDTTTLSLLERLQRGDVILSDGATGSYLQSHGLEPGGCPEEMNATHPGLVRGMAAEYFDTGADMVLTNSFGGNRFMLSKYGNGDRVAEFNRLAAEHAGSARPKGRYVVGSVGPTGEFMAPLGEVSQQEMEDAFADQILALSDGGVDGVDIETMTALEESKAAIKAAKENTDLAVMATMSFDKGPRGLFTMMGVTPRQAAEELSEAGADVVGTNCGNGIDVMVEIAREIRAATDVPVLVHSNAGIPSIRKGIIEYPETPEYMAERVEQLAELGVNVIGGCCGTTPKHIRAFVDVLRNR